MVIQIYKMFSGFLHYLIIISLEMSDEPDFFLLTDRKHFIQSCGYWLKVTLFIPVSYYPKGVKSSRQLEIPPYGVENMEGKV